MKRVLIIGSPGTGKSTFARKLAAKTGLPLIHIDYYYHDPSKDYYTNKVAWRELVMKMAAKDRWIMDGNFGNTMGERMQLAETIFYFDLPRRTALWGVLKRRFHAVKGVKRDDMPEGWKEKANWKFLTYVWGFKKAYEPATKELLARNQDKQIIIFKNHKQIADYLKSR